MIRENDNYRKSRLSKIKKGEVGWLMYEDIDSLEKIYRKIVDEMLGSMTMDLNEKIGADKITTLTKIMQGIERCIDLKMKLMGLDGKNQTILNDINEKSKIGANKLKNNTPQGDDIIINAEMLSGNVIKELKEIIDKKEVDK